jgi:hypothetical protein
MVGKWLGKNKAQKFNENTTIKDLKIFISKFFKIDKSTMVIKYRNTNNS